MSFQTKLFLVFAPFFVIVVALMLFFTIQFERHIVKQFESDIQEIVHTVHYSTQRLATRNGRDSEALERFIEEIKSNTRVHEVSVVGSTQKIVASSNPKKVGQKSNLLSGREIIVKAQYGVEDSGGRPVRYDFVQVPIIRDNKVIGMLETSIVVNDFGILARQLNTRTLAIASIALFIMFFVSFFALYRLSKPLRQLSGAAEHVASGDLSVHLPHKGNDEIGRLTKSFNAMTQKLNAQKQLEDKLRSLERHAILAEMASNLAHEIRNPLNLINLTADHLGHEYLPEDEDRKKSYSELIAALKAEVQHLNTMVNEFLTIGRPSRLKKTEFSLAELFEQLQVLVKLQIISKNISLEISGGGTSHTINADIEQMRLVFLNLLLNAVEAVQENGRIAITVEARGDGKVIIKVIDDGPGVAPENLERIFEPYFSKRPGGTGLGLPLARRIVEEHGGTITASNHLGGGAQFEIILPIDMGKNGDAAKHPAGT
jgi:signal transduction histidine kinase